MNLRTVCTTFAIALAACAVSPSLVSADEAIEAPQQKNVTINDQVAQLQADFAGGKEDLKKVAARIDMVVEQIDDLLDAGADNEVELLGLRKVALDLRSMIGKKLGKNGEMLAALRSGGGGIARGGSNSGIMGGTILRGGGGGSSAAGGSSGLGGVALLGGIGAAIAIPIAVSNDGKGGDITSPSGT